MASLRKNIWLLFFLLVLLSMVLLVSVSVSRWKNLTEYYRVSQQGLAAQWFGTFSSILEQQEAILTLMGEDLLTSGAGRSEDLQPRLDALMNLSPDLFSGFALISPQGDVLERTSNLDNNVTNVLNAPEVRDSFAYALETDKMVLGRTYFAPRLAVPARKGCSEIVAHFLLTSGSADFSKAEDDQKTIRSSVFCCVLNAASASQQPFPALQTHLSCIRQ